MPVQSMSCPKCGKWATEYDVNKWQCLSCNTKFIYEPPASQPESKVIVEHDLGDTELVYVCSKCNLRVSGVLKPYQVCATCGARVCPDCLVGDKCNSCFVKSPQGCLSGCGGCAIFVIILLILFPSLGTLLLFFMFAP